jgi:replicative DNA helicase
MSDEYLGEEARAQTPRDVRAERALLGCCLRSAQAIAECTEIVRPQDFYRPAYGRIYQAILACEEAGEAADPVTIYAKLRALGLAEDIAPSEIEQLAGDALRDSAAGDYARIVAELARKRRLAGVATELRDAALDPTRAADDVVARGEGALAEEASQHAGSTAVGIGEVVQHAMDRADAAERRGGGLSGLLSGFLDLDRLLGGFETGSLVVVGARPSMGKTAFLLGIAQANAERATPVHLFSLEMSGAEIGERLLSMASGVSQDARRRGSLTSGDWERLIPAQEGLCSLSLTIDDRSELTLSQLRLGLKAAQRRHGLGLVLVDYLQLVAPLVVSERREVAIREAAEGLKAIAKDFGVVVVAAAQLNRSPEARRDARPQLSDLRESGGIEQAADVVLALYRDEVYDRNTTNRGVAEVLVLKNRSGPTGTVTLQWDAACTRFRDLSLDATRATAITLMRAP